MNSPRPTRLSLEVLETRRAPAALAADDKTVTFTDAAGDAATVVFGRAVLTANNVNTVFAFDTGSVDGTTAAKQQLQEIDLTGLPAGLSVTATGKGGTGNPVGVDVGFVDAAARDERAVAISGDLGRVVAGDANPKTPGLGSLAVGSLGVRGTATQAAGGTLDTVVTGTLGKLTVAGDVLAANIADGSLGRVTIGGSLKADPVLTTAGTGEISSAGNIGLVRIAGDVRGGPGTGSGQVYAAGNIGRVTIGGSVLGGGGTGSGSITAEKKLGRVTVNGDLTGGDGNGSADIYSGSGTSGVRIGGNLAGGNGSSSADVFVEAGTLGKVTIGGSLTGGAGSASAGIQGGKVAAVVIAGDLVGGAGPYSGYVHADSAIGSVTVKDLIGGGGTESGTIRSFGKIDKVVVSGNVTGTAANLSAAISAAAIGTVTVGGAVAGGTGQGSASIESDTRIGKVAVTGAWTGASISAGWQAGPDGQFGTPDDVADTDAMGNAVNGKIGKVVIGGTVDGTTASGDHFAFLASQIGAVKINGTKEPLKRGPRNDEIPLGTQGDFDLVER